MSNQKPTMESDTSQIVRQFKYHLGECKLEFGLRIDVKKQLKEYQEILAQAQVDIQKQLDDMKKD